MLTTKEVNFSCAELVNEAREAGEAKSDEKVEKAYDSEDESDDHGYISTIRFNNRMYTKYRPHYTGVFDDYLFVNYEYKNFMRKYKNNTAKPCLETEFEKELCTKCEKINIDNENENERSKTPESPTSSILTSIENELSNPAYHSQSLSPHKTSQSKFLDLKNSFLSNLPINIIECTDMDEDIPVDEPKSKEASKNLSKFFVKRQSSSNLIQSSSSSASNMNDTNPKLKAKTLKKKAQPNQVDIVSTPTRNKSNTPLKSLLSTTSKKRSINLVMETNEDLSLVSQMNENLNLEPKTPQSKRRLIMSEHQANSPQASQGKINPANLVSSPIRTILHYFSPKPPGK